MITEIGRLGVRLPLRRLPRFSGIAPLGRVGTIGVPIIPVALGLRVIGGYRPTVNPFAFPERAAAVIQKR